jgi:glycosyltransferase involved in cell wall biosynthesis
MRVLVIVFSMRPRPDGDYLRFHNIFPRLAARHEMHLCYIDRHGESSYLDAYREAFETVHAIPCASDSAPLGRIWSHLTFAPDCAMKRRDPTTYRHLKAEIAELVHSLQIELVHSWDRCALELVDDCKVPVLFDMCDALSLDLLRSLQGRWQIRETLRYLRLRRFEARIVSRFPVTFVTDADAAFFRRQHLTRVIPNGVEISLDAADPNEPDDVVAFSGNMGFPPNVDAVMFFYREVFPMIVASRPSVRWHIIGTEPTPEVLALAADPNVVVTGYVNDLRAHLRRAAVVVCPMITGTGIKNKVLEAMSLGRAVVSTPLGTQGIAVSPGVNIAVAADPRGIATKVLELLDDRSLRNRMGAAALDLVARRYSWSGVTETFDQLYRELGMSNTVRPKSRCAVRANQGRRAGKIGVRVRVDDRSV